MLVTWSAHNASQVRNLDFELRMFALLPLLGNQAHVVSTIRHAIDKIKEVVSYPNPKQTPVVMADQHLFPLAKQKQWNWPKEYDSLVVVMGALYIEMAALRMADNFL